MDGWIYQSMEIVWAVGCGFTYLGRVIASTPVSYTHLTLPTIA